MVTNLKRKDIKNILVNGVDGFYNQRSLVADKLRVIYVNQGWTHMTEYFGKVDSLVEERTEYCLEHLLENPTEDEVSIESAGLMVRVFIDELDFINLDYYFRLS